MRTLPGRFMTQAKFFQQPEVAANLPEGMRYRSRLISQAEEKALLAAQRSSLPHPTARQFERVGRGRWNCAREYGFYLVRAVVDNNTNASSNVPYSLNRLRDSVATRC